MIERAEDLPLGTYRGLEHRDPNYGRRVYKVEPGFVYYEIDCGGGLWVDGGRTHWWQLKEFFNNAERED